MPIRGSPNGARHPSSTGGRDRPEWVVAINRNAWSQSIGTAGRDHPVRAGVIRTSRQLLRAGSAGRRWDRTSNQGRERCDRSSIPGWCRPK